MLRRSASSRPVQAHACTMCDQLYPDKEDADACCRCRSCKKKHKKQGYRSLCPRCSYGDDLRIARREVRRHEKDLQRAQECLDELIRQGRPA